MLKFILLLLQKKKKERKKKDGHYLIQQVLLNNHEMPLFPFLEQEVFPRRTLTIHFCLLWIIDTYIYTYWALN